MLRKSFEHTLSSLITIGSLWMVKVKDNKKNNGEWGKLGVGEEAVKGKAHECSRDRGDI